MISNILAPLVAGLFFLLYFIYFVIANPSRAPLQKYFVLFLLSMSAFTLGRPLQLLLGPHPWPLIIVNIRVFLLCAVIVPIIILASNLFTKRKRRTFEVILICVCVLLGLTYVVFNTLGTRSSKVLFEFAGITARDNHTPSLNPPFYGREVTIAVQVVIGVLLLLFSLINLITLRRSATSFNDLLKNKTCMFNGGVCIFAASFIVGSLLKQWEIYYVASVLSALLFGGSVMIDAKEVHSSYEKLIPFIKEDIIDNVAFSESSKTKLMEMLSCLGKGEMNTIIVIKIKGVQAELDRNLKLMDDVLHIIGQRFGEMFSEKCFLSLPLSDWRIMVALRLPEREGGEARDILWDTLESIRSDAYSTLKCGLAIGIGRSYRSIEELHVSYHEAISAQEYAERLDASSIVHVENINGYDKNTGRYPVKEKEALLAQIKVGDVEKTKKAFASFMTKFTPFISERPEVLKVRLYEFVGSLIDAAIVGGGDETRLNELVAGYFDDIDHAKDPKMIGKWMEKVVSEIAEVVAHVYENRSKSLIKRATKYIEEHYSQPLSYRDVAKEVFISPSYFLFLFKRETGLTFVDYLTNARIEAAKRLLSSTEKNITEIAYDVGFNNSNYFSSTFRKLVGTSPKEYRGPEKR